MQKNSKIRLTYGLALTLMTANLATIMAHAEDFAQPSSSDTRPPQIAPVDNRGPLPPANDTAPIQTRDTTRILGTLSPDEMATSPLVPPDLLPQPRQSGDIAYITGGFGDEERSLMEAAKNDYNLHVMAANKAGQFVADTHLVIRDHKGDELLDTIAGPLFYARLPAGSYILEASNEGETRKQNIVIGKSKTSNVHLSW